jgi:hypothetical protein
MDVGVNHAAEQHFDLDLLVLRVLALELKALQTTE